MNEEASQLNYGVFQLGPIVRIFKPVVEADRFGNIHIIQQSGDDCYLHSFFRSTRDGVRFLDHNYRRRNGEPYRSSPPAGKAPPAGGARK